MSHSDPDIEKKIDEINFDLPAVPDDVAKATPRIHRAPGDSTCISCEG